MPSLAVVRFYTVLVAAVSSAALQAAEPSKTVIKTESFGSDPGWEAYNNRIVPKQFRTIAQNFGYSKSNFAGESQGELGGRIWRAAKPAYYADKIEPKTLDDHLSASGSFAI